MQFFLAYSVPLLGLSLPPLFVLANPRVLLPVMMNWCSETVSRSRNAGEQKNNTVYFLKCYVSVACIMVHRNPAKVRSGTRVRQVDRHDEFIKV